MTGTIVETRTGKVEGVVEGPVTVWRGIPYAQAPVGELRFRPRSQRKRGAGCARPQSSGRSATNRSARSAVSFRGSSISRRRIASPSTSGHQHRTVPGAR